MHYLSTSLKVFIGLGFLLPFLVYGQVNPFESSVEISITPENPGNNTEVTANLFTNSFNQDSAYIAWALNGQVLTEGIGNKTFRFDTGNSSNPILLEAIIEPRESSEIIRKSITITPAHVDIIWESEGYTPPFYMGKSHIIVQSKVFFTALPNIQINGTPVSHSELIYTWSKDGKVLTNHSGYGRRTMVHELDFLSRPFTLSVEVSTRDRSVTAQKSMFINPREPQLVFYVEDPLEGLQLETGYTRGSIPMRGQELWIQAVPYFSDEVDYRSGTQIFKWTMNGAPVSQGSFRDKITLRRPDGVENGQVNVSLNTQNSSKILQTISESFSITLDGSDVGTNNSRF